MIIKYSNQALFDLSVSLDAFLQHRKLMYVGFNSTTVVLFRAGKA